MVGTKFGNGSSTTGRREEEVEKKLLKRLVGGRWGGRWIGVEGT